MSAILSADDLNDFISPGVACIKPIETLPAAPPPQSENETEVILDGHPSSAPSANEPAQISLTDCLACSGCVTSAEAVLVSLQSHAEVLSTLDSAPALRIAGTDESGRAIIEGLENKDAKLFIASVSPQTRANLAAACGPGVTESQAGNMLDHLLSGPQGLASGGKHNNSFPWVIDTSVARDITHVLGSDEIFQPSAQGTTTQPQPVLASSCPGWVCYAEKTHPHVLPHLSKVKSPQAMLGTLLKTVLSRKLGIPPSRIWHLAVMPCFDKKLEASRQELTDEAWAGEEAPGTGIRDVDCVITSKEILMLAESRGINFFSIPTQRPSGWDRVLFPDATLDAFFFKYQSRKHKDARSAGTSGGYLQYILESRAAQSPGSTIQVSRGRNADVVDYSVLVDGEPVFKAARYYGFRNIQNLVRRLKPAKPSRMPGGKPFGSARRPNGKAATLEYSYVEVMACPGGCTNGGGQLKVDDAIVMERENRVEKPGPQEQKEWLAKVDEAYFSGEESDPTPEDNDAMNDYVGGISRSHIHQVLRHWTQVTDISLDRLAFTTYREVISDVGKSTDAEKVVQLAGKIGGGW